MIRWDAEGPTYLTDEEIALVTVQVDAIAAPLAMYALAWLMTEGEK